jgi:hypothetical protein
VCVTAGMGPKRKRSQYMATYMKSYRSIGTTHCESEVSLTSNSNDESSTGKFEIMYAIKHGSGVVFFPVIHHSDIH